MIKRRKFVTALGGVAVLGTVAPSRVLAGSKRKLDSRDVDLASGLSMAKFEALLNQTFFIESPDHGNVMVRLVAVQPKRDDKPRATTLEQFSLVFRGLLLPTLPSGLYEVSHISAGRCRLHLKALALRRSQPRYRADFSLL